MTGRRLGTALSVVAVLAIAGCSGRTPSQPANASPVTLPPSASSTPLPHSGAPKVENPLPDSVLGKDPCQDALTPEQINTILGGPPRKLTPDSTPGIGPGCDWTGPRGPKDEVGASFRIDYNTDLRGGLSDTYEIVKPKSKSWKEIPPIQGFPAVLHHPDWSSEDMFCDLDVGISDTLTFLVISGATKPLGAGRVDPCVRAVEIAEMVVSNFRQRAGR